MISMLVIVGLFVGGVTALAVLGQHVENPADRDVTFADHMAILKNTYAEFAKRIGAGLLPAMRTAAAAAAAFGETAARVLRDARWWPPC